MRPKVQPVPPATRVAIICENFSPHLTSAKDRRVGAWAKAYNVEIAYTPATGLTAGAAAAITAEQARRPTALPDLWAWLPGGTAVPGISRQDSTRMSTFG